MLFYNTIKFIIKVTIKLPCFFAHVFRILKNPVLSFVMRRSIQLLMALIRYDMILAAQKA